MNRVNVALLGSGRIAIEVHLPTMLRMSDVDVVALVEPDNLRRAQALTLAGKVAAFREDFELDAFPGLDVAVIVVQMHFTPLAQRGLSYNTSTYTSKSQSRHLCTKPFRLSFFVC
jgi:predicted dehydrogenase